jgi:hypothetical protein
MPVWRTEERSQYYSSKYRPETPKDISIGIVMWTVILHPMLPVIYSEFFNEIYCVLRLQNLSTYFVHKISDVLFIHHEIIL